MASRAGPYCINLTADVSGKLLKKVQFSLASIQIFWKSFPFTNVLLVNGRRASIFFWVSSGFGPELSCGG